MEVVEDVLGICGGKRVHDKGHTTRQIRGIHRGMRVGDGWESTGGTRWAGVVNVTGKGGKWRESGLSVE